MERSASESVLSHSDYRVQKWGHDPKTQLGKFDRDSGEHSSLINRVIRQATRSPGPGKYTAHTHWDPKLAGAKQGNRFTRSDRFTKPLNAVPAPSQYERKDIATMPSMKAKDCLSSNPKVTLGKCSRGEKRSFIEKSIKFSLSLPGPSTYSPASKSHTLNGLDAKVPCTLEWKRQMNTSTSKLGTSKTDVASKVGPSTYVLKRENIEERVPMYSMPKDPCTNFLDKAVRETYVDTGFEKGAKTRKELPGAGHYFNKDSKFNPQKVSHAPPVKSALARAAVSTYF